MCVCKIRFFAHSKHINTPKKCHISIVSIYYGKINPYVHKQATNQGIKEPSNQATNQHYNNQPTSQPSEQVPVTK